MFMCNLIKAHHDQMHRHGAACRKSRLEWPPVLAREIRVTEGTDTNCRYHATTTARWRCDPCDLSLCTQCKPFAERVPADVLCPLCKETMADISVGAPFWHTPQQHLGYPLDRLALILLGSLAIAGMLIPVGVSMWLMGIPAFAILSWYLFHVFLTSSRGAIEAPDFHQLRSVENIELFQHFLVVSAVYALALIGTHLSGSILLAAMVPLMVAAVYPASIMMMAIEEGIRPAFDPEKMYRLAERIGMPYLILSGLVFVFLAGPSALLYPLTSVLPDWLQRGLFILVQGFAIFLIVRLVGYALFQFRRQLEYSGAIPLIDRERRLKPEEYEPAIALTDARIQTGEGSIDDARWTVGNALTRYPNHPELNEHFEQLLISTGDKNELRNHLDRRLGKLATERMDAMAVDTWLRNRKLVGKWMPRSSKARHRMGRELARRGKHPEALKFLLSLPKHNPKYNLLPEACMLAAKILEESMNDVAAAEQMRDYVKRNFPGRADDWERYGGGD